MTFAELNTQDHVSDHQALPLAISDGGYQSFAETKTTITNYIIGSYSQVRPHAHNAGKAPNVAETDYWNDYYSVAKIA